MDAIANAKHKVVTARISTIKATDFSNLVLLCVRSNLTKPVQPNLAFPSPNFAPFSLTDRQVTKLDEGKGRLGLVKLSKVFLRKGEGRRD
jgi:hypothetical protein